MITNTCKRCGKSFSHPTQNQADQALRMHIGRMHKKHIHPSTEPPAKRPYTKQKKVEVSVNYCPTCGCNLHAVAMGIAMSHK